MKNNIKTILDNYKKDSKVYDVDTLKEFIGKDIIVSILDESLFITDGVLKEVKEGVLTFENTEVDYIKVFDVTLKETKNTEEEQLLKLPKSEPSPSIEVTYDTVKALEGKFIAYYEFNIQDELLTDRFGKLINVDKENITIDIFDNSARDLPDIINLIEYDNGLKFTDESNLNSSLKTYNYNQLKGLRKLEISSLLKFIDASYLYQNCKITLHDEKVIYAYIVSIDVNDIEFKFKGEPDELSDIYIGSVLTTDVRNIEVL